VDDTQYVVMAQTHPAAPQIKQSRQAEYDRLTALPGVCPGAGNCPVIKAYRFNRPLQ
jgi:hypothetical protein